MVLMLVVVQMVIVDNGVGGADGRDYIDSKGTPVAFMVLMLVMVQILKANSVVGGVVADGSSCVDSEVSSRS